MATNMSDGLVGVLSDKTRFLLLFTTVQHDAEAGSLKKFLLLDDAVVAVKSAKFIVLRHPIDLLFLTLNCGHRH